MPYIELATNRYPVSERQIRSENPQTSYPASFPCPAGFAVVFPAPAPTHDPITQSVRELAPVLTGMGHYEQGWEIVALSVEQIAANQTAAIQGLQSSIVASTQKRLDDFAATRNYDGILSACTYATSSVPKFAAEGQYAVGARDATWATLYTIMAEVEAATRPMPTSYADIETELPALSWPA